MRLAPLISLLLATSAFAPAALAQTAPTPGTCTTGAAEAVLRPGQVEAAVFNTGTLFFGNARTNGDGYLVPRATGKSPMFAASLWLGGKVGGELRVAGSRYTNFTFWPGPLDAATGRPVNQASCAAYDRIYRVSRADVAAYQSTGITTADLRDWPAALGAPVLDGDGNPSNYDLARGDRPRLRGDDVAWWLMNDVGNAHTALMTPPMGVEARVEAFGFDAAPLNTTTFYRYTLTNRTAAALDSVYAGLFTDPDLGDATDDYIGTDTTEGMGYVYNADNTDDLPAGYGVAPPAVGFQVVSGPVGLPNGRDDDRDGMVDESGERVGLHASAYFNASVNVQPASPTSGVQYYNYLRGLWRDGSAIRSFGDGYGQTQGPVTRYVYPGDPVAGTFWSEVNNGTPTPLNAPGDRRMLVSTGPFRLAPGASETVVFAVPYARGTSNLDSVTRLRALARTVRTAYATTIEPTAAAEPSPLALTLSRPFPNPTSGRAVVRYEMPAGTRLRATLLDVLGREVAVLADGPTAAATGEFVVDGARLAPGVYRVRVVVPAGEQVLQLVVAR